MSVMEEKDKFGMKSFTDQLFIDNPVFGYSSFLDRYKAVLF